jgi:hypothetical protein
MKTKFVVVIEIKVEHPNGNFVDTNSVKANIGMMLSHGRMKENIPWAYGEKHEGPAIRHTVELRSLSEYVNKTSFGIPMDVEDIEEFV